MLVFRRPGFPALWRLSSKILWGRFQCAGDGHATVISKAEALAFLFAVSCNVPCVMALSTTYRETHSLKWTLRLALFFTSSALVLSCIIYHVAGIFW